MTQTANTSRSSKDIWKLGDREFSSRIIVGTGKYANVDETRAALAASGAEMVTVALRRVELGRGGGAHVPAGARAGNG
jgi:thiazole synthase